MLLFTTFTLKAVTIFFYSCTKIKILTSHTFANRKSVLSK